MNGTLPPLIILAAGESRRMGEPKGLVKVGGRPWLEVQLRRFAAAGGRKAVVVLGYHREEYLEKMPDWGAWMRDAGCGMLDWEGELPWMALAMNSEPENGPFSSLITGWNRLREMLPGTPAFVLPVDVPCPSGEVLQALQTALQPGVEVCVPVYQGRGGHPILAAASFFEKLRTLPFSDPQARLDSQIKKLVPENLRKIPVQEKIILLNMNHKKDFEDAQDLMGIE